MPGCDNLFLDKEVNLHPVLGFLLVVIIIEEELAAGSFEHLCHYVFHQHPLIDLQLNEDRTILKCYFCDTGLLISLAFSARGIVTNEIYQKLMFDKLEIDEGMLVENIVAQMLKTAGSKLFFYNNYDKEEAENRMQIDFLIQKEIVTSRHNISPIEVKSSTNYTLTSIKKCIKKFSQYLSTPYVLHTNDVEQKDGLVYLPLYMTPLL